MSQPVSEDDVGKRVEGGSGMAIGYVVAVEDGTPYVETDPDLTDSIKAALGWSGDESDAVRLDTDAVVDVTDDVVRIRTERGDSDAAHDDVDRDENEDWRTVGSSADAAGVPVETESDETYAAGTAEQSSRGSDDPDSDQLHTDRREDAGPNSPSGRRDRVSQGDPASEGGETGHDVHGTDLDLARAELKRASDAADAPVQHHLIALQQGVFEERTDGEDAATPKPDRIAELAEKLDGLTEETAGEVRDRIERSRDHLRDYLDGRDGAASGAVSR